MRTGSTGPCSQLATPRVLVLDELGYLPLTREEASLFFRLLVRRSERASLIVQQELDGLRRGLQRPGPRYGHPRSPAAPCHDGQHQGRELSASREEGRPAGLIGRRPKPAELEEAGLRMTAAQGTKTSPNRGHLKSAFFGQLDSAWHGSRLAWPVSPTV